MAIRFEFTDRDPMPNGNPSFLLTVTVTEEDAKRPEPVRAAAKRAVDYAKLKGGKNVARITSGATINGNISSEYRYLYSYEKNGSLTIGQEIGFLSGTYIVLAFDTDRTGRHLAVLLDRFKGQFIVCTFRVGDDEWCMGEYTSGLRAAVTLYKNRAVNPKGVE